MSERSEQVKCNVECGKRYSTSNNLLFCLLYIKHIDTDSFDNFPTTSNHISKISEDSLKIVLRPCVSYLEVLKLIFHYFKK